MTEYLAKAEEVAKVHGFTLREVDDNGTMAFHKDAEDGSHWFARPADPVENIGDVDPDADEWILGRYKETDQSEACILIEEPLSLGVILADHQRVPAPEFDKDGDGIEEGLNSWADIRWRGRTAKSNWHEFISVLKEDPALDPVFEAGFQVTTTGGGCTAFLLIDNASDTRYYVATEDATVLAHPLSRKWCVQRETEDGALIGVEGISLPEALARFRDIPAPTDDQEDPHWYLNGWDDFDMNGPAQTRRPVH